MTQKKPIWITKANGKRERFSQNKLHNSLKRAGASREVSNEVVAQVFSEIRDGMQTYDIYRRAFAILKKERKSVAHNYNLRMALMELGPSGFPFEKFVGELLKLKGYTTRTGVMMQGWCSKHEVDVSARKDGGHTLIECKFHNQPGIKTDLKVALYVHARVQDIEKHHEHHNAEGSRYHEGWLVTNTKLTSMAINYAQCAGLHTIGWNYPKEGALRDLIIETGIHPVTALTSLSKQHKRQIIDKGIVACHVLERRLSVLKQIGMTVDQRNRVTSELKVLCK